jgi:diguanylate cyclase (GGDEF)-like protein
MSIDPVDVSADAEVPPWRPELTEAIYTLLYTNEGGLDRLASEVEVLARDEGPAVYSELLYLLAHIRFGDEEAERHWKEVLRHRGNLQASLGSEVDLAVALVSYFVQVSRQLQNPKLIELKVFEETQASAYRDELTGLHNFRFFQEYLNWEVHRCERHGGSFSIVMGDIDNFKDYNDRFGHNQGNATLMTVGRTMVSASREEDIVARYGGEEFVLVMPETGKDDAVGVAERVREAIADLQLSDDDPLHRVTISFGVANYPVDAESADDLIRCADRAMYIAKARGKNQVQLYGANRRAYKRIAAVIDGEYRLFEKDAWTFSTVDLSERSLRVSVNRDVGADELMEFTLLLPEHGQKVRALGRVVRTEEGEGGTKLLAVSIVDISGRAHLALKQYLRDQEE